MTHSNDSRRPRSRVKPLGLAVLAALWLVPRGFALAATITVTTAADVDAFNFYWNEMQ